MRKEYVLWHCFPPEAVLKIKGQITRLESNPMGKFSSLDPEGSSYFPDVGPTLHPHLFGGGFLLPLLEKFFRKAVQVRIVCLLLSTSRGGSLLFSAPPRFPPPPSFED